MRSGDKFTLSAPIGVFKEKGVHSKYYKGSINEAPKLLNILKEENRLIEDLRHTTYLEIYYEIGTEVKYINYDYESNVTLIEIDSCMVNISLPPYEFLDISNEVANAIITTRMEIIQSDIDDLYGDKMEIASHYRKC